MQRLFYDQEEEHPGKPAEQLPTQNATVRSEHKIKRDFLVIYLRCIVKCLLVFGVNPHSSRLKCTMK